MDVVKDSFEEVFKDFSNRIRTSQFISVDTELTGSITS